MSEATPSIFIGVREFGRLRRYDVGIEDLSRVGRIVASCSMWKADGFLLIDGIDGPDTEPGPSTAARPSKVMLSTDVGSSVFGGGRDGGGALATRGIFEASWWFFRLHTMPQ